MAHPNEELIHRFYTAFTKGDAQTMGNGTGMVNSD